MFNQSLYSREIMAQYVIRSTCLCTRLIEHQFKANGTFFLQILNVELINMNIRINISR